MILAGTNVFVADTGNHSIRKMVGSGLYPLWTVVGPNGLISIATPAASARSATTFHYPRGMAFSQGSLFVISEQMLKAQVIAPADPSATAVQPWDLTATFSSIDAIASDANYVYLSGWDSAAAGRRIKRYSATTLTPDGTFNGTFNTGGIYPSMPSDSLAIVGPVAFTTTSNDHQLRRYDLGSSALTLIGNAASGYADGAAAAPYFNSPRALATDGTYLYIADTGNHVIRRLDPVTLDVTTYASIQYVNGGGFNGSEDGPRLSAHFDNITGLAHNGGYLYVAEAYRHRIRRINTASGQVVTLLGGYDTVNDSVGPFSSGVSVANPRVLLGDPTYGLFIANDFNIRALK
jgi:sugar lactone lactonase YvrE